MFLKVPLLYAPGGFAAAEQHGWPRAACQRFYPTRKVSACLPVSSRGMQVPRRHLEL